MNEQEKVNEARNKLRAKFGKTEKAGGMRRKNKAAKRPQGGQDKKVKEIVKKLAAQPVPDISEMNLFTKDNQVIRFKDPEVHASFQNQTMVVAGTSVREDLKDCFADVVTQLSPEQLKKLKDQSPMLDPAKVPNETDDKKPDLVNFEDEANKDK